MLAHRIERGEVAHTVVERGGAAKVAEQYSQVGNLERPVGSSVALRYTSRNA